MKSIPSSACTALVETDIGPGYLKALGGPEGPHTLVCELIGTCLAEWLGLSILDFSLIAVTTDDEIPFVNDKGESRGFALTGPAFITRAESAEPWGGEKRQLEQLANPEDISTLVVFDTWTLNCDRYCPRDDASPAKPRINRNNVLLSEEAPQGRLTLKAIDHTHCFTCAKEITKSARAIGKMKDGRVFGLFPEFREFLQRDTIRAKADRLRQIKRKDVASITQRVPNEWELRREANEALVDLIIGRAAYVAETIESKLWPQNEFDFTDKAEEPTP